MFARPDSSKEDRRGRGSERQQASSPGVSEAVLAAVGMPERLDSPFGALEFFDGLPLPDTVQRSYDALDLMRGVEVFLNCMPGASMVAMRDGFRSIGQTASQHPRLHRPAGDLGQRRPHRQHRDHLRHQLPGPQADGPVVIEAPPNALGFVDDIWQRYVTDIGLAGPDKGQGGKYLILPPDHDGDVPDGYFVARSPTYSNWLVIRALGGVQDLLTTRIYPLAKAGAPPATEFLNFSQAAFNGVHANDFSYFEEVASIVADEPAEALDPERAGQLAAIGIVTGQPFAPDERMRAILDEAARIGAAIVRSLVFAPRDPDAYYYPDSTWATAFIGGSHEFLANGARLLDARAMMHYVGTGITPAMTHAGVGVGSQYAFTARDANGAWLDGGRDYTLTLPAGIPAKTFWAIDIYDPQTRSLLQTDNPYPSIHSRSDGIRSEDNGDLVISFGPTARRPRATGSRPAPARAGSRSCASTDRWSLVRQDLAPGRDHPPRVIAQRSAAMAVAISVTSSPAAGRASTAPSASQAEAIARSPVDERLGVLERSGRRPGQRPHELLGRGRVEPRGAELRPGGRQRRAFERLGAQGQRLHHQRVAVARGLAARRRRRPARAPSARPRATSRAAWCATAAGRCRPRSPRRPACPRPVGEEVVDGPARGEHQPDRRGDEDHRRAVVDRHQHQAGNSSSQRRARSRAPGSCRRARSAAARRRSRAPCRRGARVRGASRCAAGALRITIDREHRPVRASEIEQPRPPGRRARRRRPSRTARRNVGSSTSSVARSRRAGRGQPADARCRAASRPAAPVSTAVAAAASRQRVGQQPDRVVARVARLRRRPPRSGRGAGSRARRPASVAAVAPRAPRQRAQPAARWARPARACRPAAPPRRPPPARPRQRQPGMIAARAAERQRGVAQAGHRGAELRQRRLGSRLACRRRRRRGRARPPASRAPARRRARAVAADRPGTRARRRRRRSASPAARRGRA